MITSKLQLSDVDLKSRLSQGPSNPNHRRFRDNEKIIQKVLDRALGERSLGLTVPVICRQSGLTAPTFYLHHRNVNEALRDYEVELEREFVELLVGAKTRQQVFVRLLLFVKRHRGYFRSTFQMSDFYMMEHLIRDSRVELGGFKVSDKSFTIYLYAISAVVLVWGKFDGFDLGKTDDYVGWLMRLRVLVAQA